MTGAWRNIKIINLVRASNCSTNPSTYDCTGLSRFVGLCPTLIPTFPNGRATPSQSNVLFTSDSPQEIVEQLAAKGHTEAVIIGGTQTVNEFLKAGLVNEIILVVEPVLFGNGLPLVKDVEFEYQLALLDVKKLKQQYYSVAL